MASVHRLVLGAALALAGAVEDAAAQTIAGRLLDHDSGAPIAGAQVLLVDSAGGQRARALSDSAGAFRLAAARAGSYALEVRALGYPEYASRPLSLNEAETLSLAVRLGRDAIPIEPLVVTARRRPATGRLAEFERRRLDPARAGGHFITREDVERRPTVMPTHLLVGIPGVTVQRLHVAGRAYMGERGVIVLPGGPAGMGCAAQVYIDGVLFRQQEGRSVDDVLNVDMIGGIEVYPRAGSAPVEYDRGRACGVVLYWTRPPERGGATTWRKVAVGLAGFAVILGLALTN